MFMSVSYTAVVSLLVLDMIICMRLCQLIAHDYEKAMYEININTASAFLTTKNYFVRKTWTWVRSIYCCFLYYLLVNIAYCLQKEIFLINQLYWLVIFDHLVIEMPCLISLLTIFLTLIPRINCWMAQDKHQTDV